MKNTFVSKEKLEEIIHTHPTPFYLYDEAGIRQNARNLNNAFAWNRGYKEFFAIKATPNPTILRILKQEGCGVDCSSLTELLMAQKCGFTGDEIMFSSNVTPAEEYILARKLNATINLDDFTHIEFLHKTAGLPKKICLRFNPGANFNIRSQIMNTPREAKYGFTKAQLIEGIKILRRYGVEEFGLHAFLSSNSLNEAYYPALTALLLDTAVEIKAQTDAQISFINLSGGIGIPYRPEDEPVDIFKIGKSVQEVYLDFMQKNNHDPIRFCTELGRFMLAPFGVLVATAIHKKEIYKNYIGVDACAVNLMRPAMYGAYHHITVAGKENASNNCIYDVVGSLCENNDKFAIDRPLPKIDMGDRLIFHDAGAHGFAMGYNYNGKLKCAELLLCQDGSVKQIRRAETPQDYFATLNFNNVP